MAAHPQLRADCLTDLDAIEAAVQTGPLASWERLRERDPYGTFFQGSIWTLCWYRAYRTLFDPLLLVLHLDGELLGLATLAVERRTRRLAFAGDHMADYRDVLALPDYREAVLRALVSLYREGRYTGALRIGSTLPESTTADLLMKVSRDEGVPALASSHCGWRWWPDPDGERSRSRSTRHKLNVLKRRGGVALSRIDRQDEWIAARDSYYQHHSVRQIYRGKVTAFDKPEKQAFADALLSASLAHLIVLSAGGRPIAWHYGYVDRGVLYWGAPAFDVREHRFSPTHILLLLVMQRAVEWGIRGIDLTIGEDELKERNGTDRVRLPSVYLFPTWRACARARAVQAGATSVRRLFAVVGREETWTRGLRPRLRQAMVDLREAASMKPRQAARHLRTTFLRPLLGRARTVAFLASPLDAAMPAASSSGSEIHLNAIGDLLKIDVADRYALARVRSATFALADGPPVGADFHTMVTDGQLTGWAFSRVLASPMPSDLDGLTLPAGSAVLWGTEVISATASRLTELLRSVTAHRMAGGAREVWLLVESPSHHVLRAIEDAGFHLERSGRSRRTRHARQKEAIA